MKKPTISKLFLYRHRYGIGYFFLFILFVALVFLMPLISPDGLSEAEMSSAVDSHALTWQSMTEGNIVDLPYHALQHVSISFFGLTEYAIKLPSIVISLALGVLIILLLNRWFKNNVAIIASILVVLSAPFLYLAGSGIPLIMLVFWPTLLLWLGSKINGKTIAKTIYMFFFAICLLLSLFTPYLIYFAIFIVFYALVHPHLRFMIKSIPKIPFILTTLAVIGVVAVLGYEIFKYPTVSDQLFLAKNFSWNNFFPNISDAFLPFFSWSGNVQSVFLSPMIGLASIALAFTGLISTAKGFFASRNSIASIFIVFTVIVSGFNPSAAVLIIIPFAILTAHGIRYILEKWYGLFPENPYARIFGLIPISAFLGIMIISSISHFTFGYRYNPIVADEFHNDLSLFRENIEPGTTILIPAGTLSYDFYKILESKGQYIVTSNTPSTQDKENIQKIATLGKWPAKLPYDLSKIICSPKSTDSDRIYLYEDKGNN
ncbi:hypothetical protein IKG12_01990 [Candidatus Saccharibacteria bacterium]|nr:hypothetical protein [Candidatus Saccharibacteria bacterium]